MDEIDDTQYLEQVAFDAIEQEQKAEQYRQAMRQQQR